MWLARIEPTDKPDYDQRTFECRDATIPKRWWSSSNGPRHVERDTRQNNQQRPNADDSLPTRHSALRFH